MYKSVRGIDLRFLTLELFRHCDMFCFSIYYAVASIFHDVVGI